MKFGPLSKRQQAMARGKSCHRRVKLSADVERYVCLHVRVLEDVTWREGG